MSPTTTRVALRRAGTLLVAAALVAGPVGLASAEPGGEPTATTSASAEPTATGEPSASASTSPSASASASPAPVESTPASPSPSPSTVPSSAAPGTTTPAPSAPAQAARVLAAAELAAAAGEAAPQTGWAAGFIARTLAAGGDHYVYPDFDAFDGGNTIDAIIALAASRSGSTQLGESLDYLEANVGGYTGAAWDSTYAGPTAKAVIGAIAGGADPTSFGGLDLVAELQATEGAVEPGRFSDLPVDCGYPQCDYSNTIGQALGIIALARAGETVSAASVAFLEAQQCPDGGLRGDLDAEGCTSDPDATAFGAQALVAADSAAADAALDWLADAQGADGSLESSDGVANANTTGVAAQAFAAGGRDAELADAQAFLVSLQYGCSSPAALRGGLAYSDDDRSTTAVDDMDLRATPQGTLGLSGESLLSAALVEGAAAGTTTISCGSSPTTSGPATTTPPPTGGQGGDGSDSDGGTTPVASGPGSLAQTGSDLLWPVAAGLLLLVAGGLAVAASRRRGAHA